jgi:hypothetical protein
MNYIKRLVHYMVGDLLVLAYQVETRKVAR